MKEGNLHSENSQSEGKTSNLATQGLSIHIHYKVLRDWKR